MKQTFYERLIQLSRNTHKSVNQIERQLGYPRNALHNYRYGGKPSGERVIELANYFHVKPEYLLNGKESKAVQTLFNELDEEEKIEVYLLSQKWLLVRSNLKIR